MVLAGFSLFLIGYSVLIDEVGEPVFDVRFLFLGAIIITMKNLKFESAS